MLDIKMDRFKNKKTIALILFLSVLVVVLLLLSFRKGEETKPNTSTPTPTIFKPLPAGSKGIMTTKELITIKGKPIGSVPKGGADIVYFNTSNPYFKDEALIEDGRIVNLNDEALIEGGNVVYLMENIFDSSRGTYSSFTQAYNDGVLKLYDEDYPWYISLKGGVGIQTDEIDILKIVFFVPQSEKAFMGSVAPYLGISKEIPEDNEPEIINDIIDLESE